MSGLGSTGFGTSAGGLGSAIKGFSEHSGGFVDLGSDFVLVSRYFDTRLRTKTFFRNFSNSNAAWSAKIPISSSLQDLPACTHAVESHLPWGAFV